MLTKHKEKNQLSIAALDKHFGNSLLGADKLEHGIDFNESEDDAANLSNDGLAEVDGLDSEREYTGNEAEASNNSQAPWNHGFGCEPEMEEILSIQNLPGCVNYGFEGKTSNRSLRNRKSKCEIGVQVDLEDE